jgi:ABC-type transport system involved in cytochrome c biogenesis permease subunit
MLYIHPPLAIAGYVFIFLFTFFLAFNNYFDKRITQISSLLAWSLTFLGLVTGMLWAQLAWGSYWSWDPKETLTLTLFLALSTTEIAYFEKAKKLAKWLAVLSCVLVVITAFSTFIIAGLHSFA